MGFKTTHVIGKCSFSENKIWCICSWEGTPEEYEVHKIEAKPIAREHINKWKVMYGFKRKQEREMSLRSAMREVDFLDNLIK